MQTEYRHLLMIFSSKIWIPEKFEKMFNSLNLTLIDKNNHYFLKTCHDGDHEKDITR